MNYFIKFLLFAGLYLTAVRLFSRARNNKTITLFPSVVHFPLRRDAKDLKESCFMFYICSPWFLCVCLFQGLPGPAGEAGIQGRLGSQGNKVGHILHTHQSWDLLLEGSYVCLYYPESFQHKEEYIISLPLYPCLILREPATSKDVHGDPDEVRESSSASSHEGGDTQPELMDLRERELFWSKPSFLPPSLLLFLYSSFLSSIHTNLCWISLRTEALSWRSAELRPAPREQRSLSVLLTHASSELRTVPDT